MIELTLTIANTLARLDGGPEDLHKVLNQELTITDIQYRSPTRRTEETYHPSQYFPARKYTTMWVGVVPTLLQNLRRRIDTGQEIELTIKYQRSKPMPEQNKEVDYDYFLFPLYDHQKRVIDAVRVQHEPVNIHGWEVQYPVGVINAATNAGKNAIMLGIAHNYPKAKVLMIVDSVSIANQAVEEFRKAEFKVTPILAGTKAQYPRYLKQLQQITVTTPITMANFLDKHKEFKDAFDIVLVDECHKTSVTTNKLLATINSPIRLGLSGTPFDGRNAIARARVKEQLGEEIVQVTVQETISQGLSREPVIYMHKVVTPPGNLLGKTLEETTSMSFHEQENLLLINNISLHDKVCSIILEEEVRLGYVPPTVVFVRRVEHGNRLLKYMQSKGINVGFANGFDNNTTYVVDQFNKGQIDVLIGTKTINTGLNMGIMEMAIFATGGKSMIELFQKIGRGLRRKEGFDTIPVHDFVFGQGIFDAHSKERMKAYKSKGYTVNYLYEYNKRTFLPL